MRFLLIGYGRMGHLIEQTAVAGGDTLVAAIDTKNLETLSTLGKVADVVIDFSSPAALEAVEAYIRRTGTPYLSGTTGLSREQVEQVQALGAYAPVLYSANYSVGVAVMKRVLGQISDILKPDFDIEITETHHNQKVDAPSGTAKLLLEAIDPHGTYTPVYGREGLCGKRDTKEIGIHALRGGTVAGTHTVHFFGADEELEFTHRANSRQIFAAGAVKMARLLCEKTAGVYDLQKILFGE